MKAQHYSTNIFIVLWAIYFLLATTGVSLQHLYCHCTNQTFTSLFEISSPCERHHLNKTPLQPCCQAFLAYLNKDKGTDNFKHCASKKSDETSTQDDCCAKNTHFVKADIDGIYSPIIQLLSVEVSRQILIQKPLFTVSWAIHSVNTERPPPNWQSGIQYLHFIQVYLC